jgi:hypothetical protein
MLVIAVANELRATPSNLGDGIDNGDRDQRPDEGCRRHSCHAEQISRPVGGHRQHRTQAGP